MTSSTSPQTSTSTQASTPTDQSAPRSEPESRKGDWAGGLTVFAGVILIVVGLFQFFQGLAAIVKGSFYVVAPNNIYEFSVSGWGWIHLVLGIVLAVTGYFILSGQPWARAVGIGVAALSALANFLFIPYYPIWALILIALDVAVIWALATYKPQS